ncbi:TetR/AcrR family transcriptional regulator [Rhodococcoides fascians A21d2]|uniref:TetR/AcrR family transcriptional regulator n=1 Tax=Nocardiaceae TaxID=85025 RepID=UPI000561CCEA|nr:MULTISPECIES: TetR/AcrR family transcriptional regulator [Rhodococcus]OZC44405.1 TetR/AcrR family transcriptional regulator [Rhodococcus sp. WWJCD1]QII01450.1 TetR/AcrR family transcriptional regulator [Rhodococcus fascians A21d2]
MSRTGRPRQFDEDRALEAAMVLFWENGYEATSLAQLRSSMGMSSASFYGAFGSKEGLFAAVVQRYIDSYGRATAPLADESMDPRDALEKTLRGSVAMQTDATHPLGCLVGLGGIIDGPDAGKHSALAARRSVDRRNIAALIERAVDRGQLDPSIPIDATATLFHSFLLGLSPLARDGVTADALQASVSAMMTFWDSMHSR